MGREHQDGQVNLDHRHRRKWAFFHVGAFAALFMFSWKESRHAFAIFLLLRHQRSACRHDLPSPSCSRIAAYRVPKWLEYFITACGTTSSRRPGPIFWVTPLAASHHQNVPTHDGDPHTHARRRLVGPRRLDHLRPRAPHQNRPPRPLRSRPHPRRRPRLAQPSSTTSRSSPPAPSADRHRRAALACRPPIAPSAASRRSLWGTFSSSVVVYVSLHATWLVNSIYPHGSARAASKPRTTRAAPGAGHLAHRRRGWPNMTSRRARGQRAAASPEAIKLSLLHLGRSWKN